MSKFVNNVRSRLHKEGLTGFSKQQIEAIATEAGCKDLNDPSSESILSGAEILKRQREGAITEQPEEVVDVAAETEWQEDKLDVPPVQDENGEEQPTIPEATALVRQGAAKLGLVIPESKIVQLADLVDTHSEDLNSILAQVENLLTEYINSSADNDDAAIAATMANITNKIVHRSELSQQKFADGLSGISDALQSSREETKSQISGILQRLKPTADIS